MDNLQRDQVLHPTLQLRWLHSPDTIFSSFLHLNCKIRTEVFTDVAAYAGIFKLYIYYPSFIDIKHILRTHSYTYPALFTEVLVNCNSEGFFCFYAHSKPPLLIILFKFLFPIICFIILKFLRSLFTSLTLVPDPEAILLFLLPSIISGCLLSCFVID